MPARGGTQKHGTIEHEAVIKPQRRLRLVQPASDQPLIAIIVAAGTIIIVAQLPHGGGQTSGVLLRPELLEIYAVFLRQGPQILAIHAGLS